MSRVHSPEPSEPRDGSCPRLPRWPSEPSDRIESLRSLPDLTISISACTVRNSAWSLPNSLRKQAHYLANIHAAWRGHVDRTRPLTRRVLARPLGPAAASYARSAFFAVSPVMRCGHPRCWQRWWPHPAHPPYHPRSAAAAAAAASAAAAVHQGRQPSTRLWLHLPRVPPLLSVKMAEQTVPVSPFPTSTVVGLRGLGLGLGQRYL
eukprot:COSAG01_NODE_5113_length_4479_cov_201.866971_7_plen_206_part_00